MKKKSFWKRCNRGFIVSMALLIAVLGYVTGTQVMLSGQKKEIRAVADQVQTLLADAAKTSTEDAQTITTDKTKEAAYRDTTKKALAGLFVKDAAYLDESTARFVFIAKDAATNERTIRSLSKQGKPIAIIRIDEDTAAVSMTASYKATGTWYAYDDNSSTPLLQERKGTLDTEWVASFVKENGQWKLYRISNTYADVW